MFRIGSVTKTFTAIAVVQLREEGLVDPRRARQRLPALVAHGHSESHRARIIGGSRLGPAGFHGPGKWPRSLDGPTHRT